MFFVSVVGQQKQQINNKKHVGQRARALFLFRKITPAKHPNSHLSILDGGLDFWRLSGDSFETLWGLSGDSVETLWRLSGDSLETVWGTSGDSVESSRVI